ncbi:MAG: thioesterase family protein [Chloroflexi bacterium]|nr:thioesterase family protein [Chloroflexota bacterium]
MSGKTFKQTFPVRSYECDFYGHVNNANYLRYMQQAAADASAAAGWDEARYHSIGHLWLIRETDIEYLIPLRYGDTVEITTWAAEFRRVRSTRYYELRNGSGEVVSRAKTDWVYVHRATGRPAAVPPEMIADFAPPDLFPTDLASPNDITRTLPAAFERKKFPAPPPPPPGVFTQRRLVEWRDVDQERHVNNATYLNYLEEAGFGATRFFGWPIARMMAEKLGIVARRLQIQYRLPATFGEEIAISTFLSETRRSTTVRHYSITRADDGVLLAQARGLFVFVNPETGRITRLPPQIMTDFASHIAGSIANVAELVRPPHTSP